MSFQKIWKRTPKYSVYILFIWLSITNNYISAQTTDTYSVPGTYSWIVPPCVTEITVQVWGAGGGGGGSIAVKRNSSDPEACAGAGGGGGGGFTSRTFTVIPGQSYSIVVGSGGTGGTGGAGSWDSGITTAPTQGATGGASSFSGNGISMLANGGTGGLPAGAYNNACDCDVNVIGAGGSGGTSSGGTVNFTGGNGAAGYILNLSTDKSGAGGGGAGPGGNGGNAPLGSSVGIEDNFAGGAGNSPGGNGGTGRMNNSPSNTSKNGGNGFVIGGGGGGGLNHMEGYGVTTAVGGSGARGEVRITYTAGTPIEPIFTAVSPICSGDPLPALPSTSTNGISGTWSPAVNNTTTTLYTFTPNPSPCANATTMSIAVDAQPSGNVVANATVCAGGSILIDGTPTVGSSILEYQFDGTAGAWISLGTDNFNWDDAGPSNSTVFVRAVIQNGVCPDLITSPIDIFVDPCGLPVVLTVFKGNCAGRTKTFEWTTASETNNDFFTLEKSKDGSTFAIAKIIPGAGSSTNSNNYTIDLTEDDQEFVYYRLKQTDYDGQFTYSDIIYTSCSDINMENDIIVYPNPASDEISINFEHNQKGIYQVVVYSEIGQLIYNAQHEKLTGEAITIPLNVSSGQYIIRVTEDATGKQFTPTKFQVMN